MIGAIFASVGPSIAASLYGLWVKNGRLHSISSAGTEEYAYNRDYYEDLMG
jgi:hypothetical protein